jgi:hypothetical protein
MTEPNNKTEAPWWVVVKSSNRPEHEAPKFYSGCDSREAALELALACQEVEKDLFDVRCQVHKRAAAYTYSVVPKPN